MTPPIRPLIALAWTLVIFGLCWTPRTLLPIVEEPTNRLFILQLDKIVHLTLFAGFSFLWRWAGVGAWWVVGLGVLGAFVSEAGQATAFVNREAEWSDGTADVLGVLAGLAALVLVRRLMAPAKIPSAETP